MMPALPTDLTPFERHFADPPWAGELPGADWIGEAGSLGEGELIRFFAQADGERLAKVRFMAFGCAATLAAASAAANRLQGRTLDEAKALGPGDIAAELGGLRQDQAHGAHLAQQAVRELVADARGEILPVVESTLVCTCYRVSEASLRQAISDRQLCTLDQVAAATLAGKGCGSCHGEIRALIDDLAAPRGPKPQYVPPPSASLSLQQKAARVLDQLETLRPRLQAAGTDALLVGIDGDTVIMRFLGSLGPDGHTPLPRWVEAQLQSALWPSVVVAVSP
jgi:NifU-like protein